MMEIVLGLLLIALGIWGIYDEYYYVADIAKGGFPLMLIFSGLLATLAGVIPYRKEKKDNV
nr:hypothetical protein [Desulfobulbaceae bacterium]